MEWPNVCTKMTEILPPVSVSYKMTQSLDKWVTYIEWFNVWHKIAEILAPVSILDKMTYIEFP
jgi:hypothetical protein